MEYDNYYDLNQKLVNYSYNLLFRYDKSNIILKCEKLRSKKELRSDLSQKRHRYGINSMESKTISDDIDTVVEESILTVDPLDKVFYEMALGKNKKQQVDVKTVVLPWKDPVDNILPELNPVELDKIVEQKKKSNLAELLESVRQNSNVFYKHFMKASISTNKTNKTNVVSRYSIIFHPEVVNNTLFAPLEIEVDGHSLVSDVIGYICYLLTEKYPDISFRTNINSYKLLITDGMGDIDSDMPPLTQTKPIKQYEFTELCFLCDYDIAKYNAARMLKSLSKASTFNTSEDTAIDSAEANTEIVVSVFDKADDETKIRLPSADCTLKDVIDLYIKNDAYKNVLNQHFYLTHVDKPDTPLMLDQQLNMFSSYNFKITFEFMVFDTNVEAHRTFQASKTNAKGKNKKSVRLYMYNDSLVIVSLGESTQKTSGKTQQTGQKLSNIDYDKIVTFEVVRTKGSKNNLSTSKKDEKRKYNIKYAKAAKSHKSLVVTLDNEDGDDHFIVFMRQKLSGTVFIDNNFL